MWYLPPERPASRPPSIKAIREATQDHYSVTTEDMLSWRRERWIAWPRQMAMYITWKVANRSLPEIGMAFDRDHTTVIHACRAVQKRIAERPEWADAYREIRRAL